VTQVLSFPLSFSIPRLRFWCFVFIGRERRADTSVLSELIEADMASSRPIFKAAFAPDVSGRMTMMTLCIRYRFNPDRIADISIVERKIRRRQSTDDGNVEISGRDLRKAPGGRCVDRRRTC
jgi:hypothetical protein